MNSRFFRFAGGKQGQWSVVKMQAVIGESLPEVARVDIASADGLLDDAEWVLRGVTSNERYVTRGEKNVLVERQASIGRPEVNHAAIIPIRKNATWWAMAQDERRAVFEDQSRHVQDSLKYLPAIARRLHHCRDLGANEPFDFVTLFEYAATDSSAFEELVAMLRATPEWKFVDRELDIRLVRNGYS